MDQLVQHALIILALPLVGFVIQIFFGRRLPNQGDWVPTGAIFLAAVISVVHFLREVLFGGGMEPVTWETTWLQVTRGGGAPPFQIGFGILIDNMTLIMLAMVTTVSFLVHLFSTGYMAGEERYSRFFAFLGLFTFSMIGLVIVNNIMFLFIFWELVGLCSYFLIGFYFEKKSAQNAANKAFITTRVGDLGFFLGIMLIGLYVGNFDYTSIFYSVEHADEFWATDFWGTSALVVAGILVFFGAVGKSAQFPLHVWLPDAMEGPTPVSALIHAATMVAAGVYMVARLFPFFAGQPFFEGDYFASGSLTFIAMIGGITALLAATIAVVQYDIKKVLAYSTISQLGFMMIGLGVGALWAGMFHLVTHAFFKALLFLGSGSVIHGCHHEQDMRKMGGLRTKMPWTFLTFSLGTLALAGFPLFSGFWSKEPILGHALGYAQVKGSIWHWLPFLFATVAAFLTAFYMARCVGMTFFGKPRDHHVHDHAHESPPAMVGPLVFLAILAVFAGGIPFLPEGFNSEWFKARVSADQLGEWYAHVRDLEMERGQFYFGEHAAGLGPVAAEAGGHAETPAGEMAERVHHNHLMVTAVGVGVMALGLFLGAALFIWRGRSFADGIAKVIDPLAESKPVKAYQDTLINLYWIDEFYYRFFFKGLHGAKFLAAGFDRYVIEPIVNTAAWVVERLAHVSGRIDHHGVDGVVRMTGEAILESGEQARKTQTGRLQDYLALSFLLIGVVFVIAVLLTKFTVL